MIEPSDWESLSRFKSVPGKALDCVFFTLEIGQVKNNIEAVLGTEFL
jgi:hypothetical protein